ncbi:MAG: thiamine phosphate synthase [Hydrogenimonas sp.]|nr:thiamine phosphate synthase [Hydrogenimonas sp.]
MKLYALLDEESLRHRGWSLERFIEGSIALGAELLQYRNKRDDIVFVKRRLEEIVSLFPGRVIVNDYPELAEFCGGVHLGQEDLLRYGKSTREAVESIRAVVKKGWIGISTHNEDEILEANSLDIDYIGLGACRATGTKSDARVLGLKRVGELAALSSHPVAAIGGVRLSDNIKNATYLVVGSGLYED